MKNSDGSDSIVTGYNSWADAIMNIGNNENPQERMSLYLRAMSEATGDSSTISVLNGEMAFAQMEINERIKKLENLTITDELTGLYNKRFFNDILGKTIARVNRDKDASLIMADIDNFKLFNDRYGHTAGDRVLKGMGELLKNGVRKSDFACRYGGEEFGIILPDTDRDGALGLAYKLNRKVADSQSKLGKGGKVYDLLVNISVGVDQIRKGDSAEGLVDRVDKFLYKAKDCGRNRVVGRDGIYER